MHKCIGQNDLSARQGYYVTADTEGEALAIMRRNFPNDTHGFTVKLWKTDVPVFEYAD